MLQAIGELAPQLAEGAWAHEGAWLIGDVRLARGASVWPTAVLRGDMGPIVIGEDSNVQDGSVLHDTTDLSETVVGKRVTIGHRVILHGCHIDDDCLVGMGAIVMDNVRVGAGSFIAAGALVPPGKVIPPGSLVMGSPGRVVRSVGAREAEQIAFAWRSYRDKVAAWLDRGPSAAPG
jgi:carbonic anhydrase/acetyltransferase-like protein (isoleucine patch superfamily)